MYRADKDEHDANLFALLEKIEKSGMTLNQKKCEFRLSSLMFFGHEIGEAGIRASAEKLDAIRNA